jgi:hypothetical protein
MGEFILGVVVDVLVHVAVELFQSLGILRTAAPAGDLTVLYASELVVLLPQIGLQDFECGKEAENVDVSLSRRVGECRDGNPAVRSPVPMGGAASAERRTERRVAECFDCLMCIMTPLLSMTISCGISSPVRCGRSLATSDRRRLPTRTMIRG